MLLFYNKKFLKKCDTFDEKNKICLILDKNNIDYQTVTKGISCFKRIGKIYWFNIYVKEKDYLDAKNLISLL